jgi:ATP-dependent helicase/nuclease subunit B
VCVTRDSRIHVVSSAAVEERLQAASAFMEDLGPATEVLVVGATREAADDLAREISARRGATFGLHRLSLVQAAARCASAELARRGRVPIMALGLEALTARVTFEARQAGALSYFGAVSRFPGFAPALAAALSELRRAGVGADRVAQAGGAATEVAGLLRRFEAQLRSAGVADRATLFELGASAAESGQADALRRLPIVLLDVPIEAQVEQRFVAALTAISPAVLIAVSPGDEATLNSIDTLFTREPATVTPAAASPAAASARDTSPAEAAPPESGSAHPAVAADTGLARLRSYLFADAVPPAAVAMSDVVFFSAPGEGREVVEIARLVLDHVREGVPFDRMAILLRAPAAYWSLLEATFARAGIPAFFARGTRRPDPSGRAFLALLECARERFSARRFAEYLSLGQVPPLDPGGGPPARSPEWTVADDEVLGEAAHVVNDTLGDAGAAVEHDRPDSDDTPVVEGTLRAPWKWEALLVESAVIGGRDRWARRLTGLAADYRLRIEALRGDDPESPRIEALARDLVNLEHLRRFALPVIDQLAALPVSAPWGEWLRALEALAPLVLRRPERVMTVLAELRPLAPVGPVSLDEVRDVLLERLAVLDQRPPAARYGHVFVGGIEEARGRRFDIVFVPGLAERAFPQTLREDPILLDAVRAGIDAGLVRQPERGRRERWLFRLAAGAASSQLYLSYSRLELTAGRARVPSFYALEVQRALTGGIPPPRALEDAAARAVGARLAWPAPQDPMRAVDTEEHDLAMLDDVLRAPAGEAAGRARYLLQLNACLARSLRARWARWKSRKWMPQDGLVGVSDGTREALGAWSLRRRAYSISALQKFAACPYQFYLSAICRLEPREETAPLERLDPLTRGKLFHQVQAETMRTLQRAGLLPLTVDTEPRARRILDETFARVAEQMREELAPAIARVWQTEMESMHVDLRVWLERSVLIQQEWEPVAFELAFGLEIKPQYDPRSVAAEAVVGDFRLRGIVDLIERCPVPPGRGGGAPAAGTRGGTAAPRDEWRVTDYKTGANYTRWRMVVGGGEALQPVLYPLAVEAILGARVVEGRLFFCTRDGGFSDRVVPMDQGARATGLGVLGSVDEAVTRGFLPAAPRPRAGARPSACDICDFLAVCGPDEERRSQRKDHTALAALQRIRGLP